MDTVNKRNDSACHIVACVFSLDVFTFKTKHLCRPDIALLWFLIPLKAAKHLVCDQYRWLTIKIVAALLLLAILALFLYNMPGYMVKKMLGA
ncbi:Otoferlin Fer-1-like protein 2 [Takifugu flavidus]|uniref:Otoferlin Fer-1-like protein 2 n=1 Tax=Takifugu flavidus TaxID=433684 RepID=A0A5C6NYS5_9TELE|nr:Otoferlin Fer-1-like protein 2 [Takifugu flavidus]